MPARLSTTPWLCALLPLLLAAVLSIPQLDDDAFTGDEPKSLFVAGRHPDGPHTLAGVAEAVARWSSEQALGWPLLLFIQGRIAGWSEPAIRLLSVLAGLLTVALVARAGRDLFTPPVGILAALLLASSAWFQAYMINARAFTLVALLATLCLWCYWRIALRPGAPGAASQAGLLLGATALLYLHYVASLLLPALGLFHLLFGPRRRRWWRPLLLLAAAALLAAPQLPVFLSGMQRTVTNERLRDGALNAAGLLAGFLRLLGNNLLLPSPLLAEVLALLVPLALLALGLLHRRKGHAPGAAWMLGFVSLTMLTTLMAINVLARFMEETRIRYLMPLWPMCALLAGAGLWRLAGRWRRPALLLLALWLIAGVWLSRSADYRYVSGFFFRSDLHHVYREVHRHMPPDDFLIIERLTGYLDWRRLYTASLARPYGYLNLEGEAVLSELTADPAGRPWFWLLYRSPERAAVQEAAAGQGWIPCEQAFDAWGFSLERHAVSAAFCPDSPARLEFDGGIQLTGPEVRLDTGVLRLYAGIRSADPALLDQFSLAVHVVDAGGARVAQGDQGIGPGAFVPLLGEIDLNDLPSGRYTLLLALYDWRSGARLPARDTHNGAVADMHALHEFHIGATATDLALRQAMLH